MEMKRFAAFGAAGVFPQAVLAADADGDWKAAFRRVGFDPDAPGAQFAAYFPDVIVQRAVFSRLQVKQVLPRFVADHVMQHAEGAADEEKQQGAGR